MAQVTIPDEEGWVRYEVSGAQSIFLFDFVVWEKADLQVYVDGVQLDASDFTFAGNDGDEGGFDGGTVTLVTAVSDSTVEIVRNDVAERTAQFAAGPIGVDQFNGEFNRIQAQIRDLQRDSLRSLKIDYGVDGNIVGSAEARADKYVKFDLDGNPIVDDARGPRGETGDTGPRGFQGIQGIQGPMGPQGVPGVQAALNLIGVSPDTDGLPVSASDGDAWLTSDDDVIHIWFDGVWYPSLSYGAGVSAATVANVFYVAKNGNDSNDGRALNRPVATLFAGLEKLRATGEPGIVSVYPGVYYAAGDLDIPEGCGVVSVGGQYVTEVRPQAGFEETNMFLVNSGSYLQGFTFRGQRIDDLNDPTVGFAVAFAQDALILRSPYIRDISQVSNYDQENIVAPLDPDNSNPLVGNGAGTILADRAVLNQNSPFPYMLAFGATPRSPNGIGYCAKNGAGINGISSISIFARTAWFALNGGQVTLNNAGTQFGDISMRAKGHMLVVDAAEAPVSSLIKSTASADAIDAVGGPTGAIVNQMWSDLVAEYGAKSADYEAFTRRDAANLLRAIVFDLRAGTDTATRSFAKGLFDYKADYVFDAALLPELQWSFEKLQELMFTYISASAPRTMIAALIDVVTGTLASPVKIKFPSLVESVGHQFNNAGAGVNKNALPVNFRRTGENRDVRFSVLEERNTPSDPRGVVRWSGTDEQGNQYFPGGTRINGVTGRFEGRPIISTIRQQARRVANSRGSF